jgi:hypothetical protein
MQDPSFTELKSKSFKQKKFSQVRPASASSQLSRDSSKPRFPGLAEFRADSNVPGPQQRAELLRIAELYTTAASQSAAMQAAAQREDSQDRDSRKFQLCRAFVIVEENIFVFRTHLATATSSDFTTLALYWAICRVFQCRRKLFLFSKRTWVCIRGILNFYSAGVVAHELLPIYRLED